MLIIKLMNILDLSLYITNNKLEEKNKEGKKEEQSVKKEEKINSLINKY